MTFQDDATCVLCNGPNECAFAAGRKQCWCFEVEMSEEACTRALELVGERTCICRKCGVIPSPAERLADTAELLKKR
jgi:hypothetical protein